MATNGNSKRLERIILGSTITVAVGSFMLSSIPAQDAQIRQDPAEGPWNRNEMRNLILLGWLTTGGTGIATGIWAKSKGLTLFGVGLAVFGVWWSLWAKHPIWPVRKGDREPLTPILIPESRRSDTYQLETDGGVPG